MSSPFLKDKSMPLALRALALIVITQLCPAASGLAGPLGPPAGPITGSHKTLTEIEPRIPISAATTPGDINSLYRISAPGSYYLTGNIAGVVGKRGIEIAAPGVTLDLNGFAIVGVLGSLDGIASETSLATGASISNGSVREWGGDGIDLDSSFAKSCVVRNVCAVANGRAGIRVHLDSVIADCVALNNSHQGILTSVSCSVTGCAAASNGSAGIEASSASIVSQCAVYDNQNGISTADGATITGCSAWSNALTGITAGIGASIVGNTCLANGRGGIAVMNRCAVRANTCTNNAFAIPNGAGGFAQGSGNRIEDNLCTAQGCGVRVGAAGNVIIRNACSGNTTNWEIAENNIHGPIIDRTNPASIAVVGNAGADTLGSSHPNANFSY